MVGYEEQYHETVHNNLVKNPHYYEARAMVAKRKYLHDVEGNEKILESRCRFGQDSFDFPNTLDFDISEFCLDFCWKKGKTVINDLSLAENHGQESFNFDVNQYLFCLNYTTINTLLLTAGFTIIGNK